jgi:hypothetical protein
MPLVEVPNGPPPESSSFYYAGNVAIAKRFRSSLPDDQPEVVVSENIEEGGEEDVSETNPQFSSLLLVTLRVSRESHLIVFQFSQSCFKKFQPAAPFCFVINQK